MVESLHAVIEVLLEAGHLLLIGLLIVVVLLGAVCEISRLLRSTMARLWNIVRPARRARRSRLTRLRGGRTARESASLRPRSRQRGGNLTPT